VGGVDFTAMRKRDSLDVFFSVLSFVVDALAIFGGLMLATWLRFDVLPIPFVYGAPADPYPLYTLGSAIATAAFLLVFLNQELYKRPQMGTFVDKIPRLVKCSGVGILLTAVLAFSVQNEAVFARVVIGLGFVTVVVLLVLTRWMMFRIEWNVARHTNQKNHVMILGTDHVALRVCEMLKHEPMLRLKVAGFVHTPGDEAPVVPEDQIVGSLDRLPQLFDEVQVDQVVLADTRLPHETVFDILMQCERHLIEFRLVPDLFRFVTCSMDVQTIGDIPLLGMQKWPLDRFRNRVLKRLEDVFGALVGLLISVPVLVVAAIAIKRESPGGVFFRQERCGEGGKSFTLYKLRTMREDAEGASGPVWTSENDPRRTRIGSFLRRHNLDELPQFWNVLRGDMSLVGPRPERPHFVEQFKEDIQRYMWRHVSKPGLSGWAQVNGLRGNTSLEERVKYDLYYLENWSLAFDFKILLRTVHARENAY
jgi:exopolysaccharide biosynthesis polyprenyl glycosylphosphotransferase